MLSLRPLRLRLSDPRMPESKPAERKPRGLVLVRPGKYIQQAATMRMKQLEKDLKDSSRESAASSAAAAANTPVAVHIVKTGVIPAVEWWDMRLLKEPTLAYDSEPALDKVTSYIYHPVEVASLTQAPPPPPMPVLLTKKERKKINKRNKREMLKEKQDRVRLGLEAPAEPKSKRATRNMHNRRVAETCEGCAEGLICSVLTLCSLLCVLLLLLSLSPVRIQNLMNVLLNDTVADPSAMEAKVRAQMAERVDAHEEANISRALTSEQKAEKRRRKFAEDTSSQVSVCVYRAGELADKGGKARYQIDVNTQQWNLCGVAILHPECNVVVVEGGPKAQRRFKRLMLHRIKWRRKQKNAMEKAEAAAKGEAEGEEAEQEEEDESDSDDDDDEADDEFNADSTRSRSGACALVWSGVVPKGRFSGRFTFEACRSEVMARNYLLKMGMESYWDMCRAYRPDQIDL